MTAATGRRFIADVPPRWKQTLTSWRHEPERTHAERLFTAAIGVAGAAIGVVTPVLARGTVLAVCVGMITLCVTPGCAFVCWVQARGYIPRALAVCAASMTWSIIATAALEWLHLTTPVTILVATSGVGGLGSAAFMLTDLARYRGRSRDFSRHVRRNTSEMEPVDSHIGSLTSGGRSAYPGILFMTGNVIAAFLWIFSVLHVRGARVGSYGLLPALGLQFIAAVAVTLITLVLGLLFINTRRWPVVASLALLMLEFHATQMLLTGTPVSSWMYKHFGVVDYLVQGGAISDPLDAYQQWPGFFTAAAALVRLSGRSPLTYANWAQLFYQALSTIAVFIIARRLCGKSRTVPYIAVLLFATAFWEGQFYYSPQSTAFFLALCFEYTLLPLIRFDRLRLRILRRCWRGSECPDLRTSGNLGAFSRAMRWCGLLGIFTAITITHQLSPFFVIAGVLALSILGMLRQPLLTIALGVVISAYCFIHLPAINHVDVVTGFHISNFIGFPGQGQDSRSSVIAHLAARSIALSIWAVAGLCILLYWRRKPAIAIPAVLAVVPLTLLLVSNYDGEGVNRCFLFSSPWCAIVIALCVRDLIRMAALRSVAIGVWGLLAALGSAQAQDFGMYKMQYVPPSEIEASMYFLDHAPPNSILVQAAADFPSRVNGKYVLHDVYHSPNDPALTDSFYYRNSVLAHIGTRLLAYDVAKLAAGRAFYLVIAPSMQSYVTYFGFMPPYVLPTLTRRLEHSPYWQTWYAKDGTEIFRPKSLKVRTPRGG